MIFVLSFLLAIFLSHPVSPCHTHKKKQKYFKSLAAGVNSSLVPSMSESQQAQLLFSFFCGCNSHLSEKSLVQFCELALNQKLDKYKGEYGCESNDFGLCIRNMVVQKSQNYSNNSDSPWESNSKVSGLIGSISSGKVSSKSITFSDRTQ